MSKPQFSPSPSQVGFPLLDRRQMLVALGGLAAAGSSLGAFADEALAGDTITFGSNYSDPKFKKAMAAGIKSTGLKVKVNTVDHNKFQENITRYLNTRPDDVYCWFAGYRMRFFARKGLATDISDVWKKIAPQFSAGFKGASTGDDGKQYFVPFYNYPWAIFYRKSLFAEKGYTTPNNVDELIALCKKMKTDGLTPFAFADDGGWPAMGTFDYLNMRTNGYDFHVRLMAGKEAWTGSEVKAVMQTYTQLLEYHQAGAVTRKWEDAAQSLVKKESGMYTLGSFVSGQFTTAADLADLDFFAFPEINPKFGRDSVEAPIDGFMVSKKAKNVAGAKQLIAGLASAKAEDAYAAVDPSNLMASKKASTAKYTAFQKKSIKLIAGAKHISQFLDRDTDPGFAAEVVGKALQQFINTPGDVDSILKNIESQKKKYLK